MLRPHSGGLKCRIRQHPAVKRPRFGGASLWYPSGMPRAADSRDGRRREAGLKGDSLAFSFVVSWPL